MSRLPVSFQATARAIRPPSSGKAGSRLNTNSAVLISPSQAVSCSSAGPLAPRATGTADWNASAPATASPPPTQASTTASVTSGPATATLNSVPGESASRSILASPPKNHRSIPTMPIPRRRAISAWPSSCITSEPKNSITAATAVR